MIQRSLNKESIFTENSDYEPIRLYSDEDLERDCDEIMQQFIDGIEDQ